MEPPPDNCLADFSFYLKNGYYPQEKHKLDGLVVQGVIFILRLANLIDHDTSILWSERIMADPQAAKVIMAEIIQRYPMIASDPKAFNEQILMARTETAASNLLSIAKKN